MVPSLFIAHGSPMLAVEQTPYTRFLEEKARSIEPKAIVVFTAHWESSIVTISSSDDVYDTIYDFGGFPDELYQIKYKANGSSKVAALVEGLLDAQGIETQRDTTRGLDHGSWTILHRMYPKADIPVVQVSVNPFLPVEEQLRIGQTLQSLGEQDILVIGSGVTVHNLRMVKWGQQEPELWPVAFDDWLLEQTMSRNFDSLSRYMELAPYAKLAVPRPEHFVPYFIAMGAGNPDSPPKIINRSYMYGTLSYLCMEF